MNWHQRRAGWTCRSCGAFNDCRDAACRCEQVAVMRAELRRAIVSRRWSVRDELVIRSEFNPHYYRIRRFAGGKVRFAAVAHGMSYLVEAYRVPPTVVRQVEIFFSR